MGRKAARRSSAQETTTRLSMGPCDVSIPHTLTYEHVGDSLAIDVPYRGLITITCTSASGIKSRNQSTNKSRIINQQSQVRSLLEGLSLQLLNPKSLDNGHLLSKAVLKLYTMELPEMSFAANTGKESPFLEKCVSSGKYCTLLLRRGTLDQAEVLAAISYQILPPDTQYAEIPLAAVSKDYQHKGVGSFLFNELQRRLQDVGVVTIFCWGDQESEGFWLKQGFLKVAEVDGHGKPRKLPIKPEIRRAMSIPGSATLLVSHIYKESVIHVSNDDKGIVTPPRLVQPYTSEGLHEPAPPVVKPSPAALITIPMVGELKASLQVTPLPATDKQVVKTSSMMPLNIDGAFSSVSTQNKSKRPAMPSEGVVCADTPTEPLLPATDKQVVQTSSMMPLNIGGAFSSVSTQNESKRPAMPSEGVVCADTPTEPLLSLTFALPSEAVSTPGLQHELGELVMPNQEGKIGAPDAQRSPGLDKENISVRSYQRGRKRGILASSQVAGLEKQRKVQGFSQTKEKQDTQSLDTHHSRVLMELPDSNFVKEQPRRPQVTERYVKLDGNIQQDLGRAANVSQQLCPSIMFMNMADDNRRMQLTKLVERLGGRVTNDGNQCTHVVTREARRTLNFCNALNAGAWVVSPAWLKASVKEKRFIEESAFILKDAAFENYYKTTLEVVIQRRKQWPHGLFQGMSIYPTQHVQPPVDTLSAIVLSAGGKVLASLEEAKGCLDAIVIACEDDISEALLAAKAGLPTYSSEWLVSCIMKQELDVTTTQFAESL